MTKQNQAPSIPEQKPIPPPIPQYNLGQNTPVNIPMAVPQPPAPLPSNIPVSLPYAAPNMNGQPPMFPGQMPGGFPMFAQNRPPQQQQPQQMQPQQNNQHTGYPQYAMPPQQQQQPQPQQSAIDIQQQQQLALLQLLLQNPGLQNSPQFAPAIHALLAATTGGQGFQMPNPNDQMQQQQQQQQFWAQMAITPFSSRIRLFTAISAATATAHTRAHPRRVTKTPPRTKH